MVVLFIVTIAMWRWGFTSGLREAANKARPDRVAYSGGLLQLPTALGNNAATKRASIMGALTMLGVLAIARGVLGEIPRFRDGLDLELPVDYAVMVVIIVVAVLMWRWVIGSALRGASDEARS